ncbi:hypothetical protein D3C87_1958130 [compost metagenome]
MMARPLASKTRTMRLLGRRSIRSSRAVLSLPVVTKRRALGLLATIWAEASASCAK